MPINQTAQKSIVVVCYATVFAFVLFLLFYGLDNHPLWEDEGETAALAKNVVQFGVPKTYDGTNYIVLHGAMDETPHHTWIWSPWLQEYVAAYSFELFGTTTWAARAPFALIGWCSVVLLAVVAFKIYQSHWIGLSSALLLGTSEVFLLHARQCRYYSISVFAEILLIYGIYQLGVKKKAGIWLAALALSLQFYSNYIVAVANIPAMLALAWWLRKKGKSVLSQVAITLGVFVVAVLPWLFYAHPWEQGKMTGHENYLAKAYWYVEEFHFHFIPLCFLLLPLASWAFFRRSRPVVTDQEKLVEQTLLCLLPLYLVVILMAPGGFLRYLLPVLPVACVLAVSWTFRHCRWRFLAVLVILVQSSCNLFAVVTGYRSDENPGLQFPLVKYIRGMSVPYTNCIADVAEFFETHAHPGESILSYDSEFPLMFYTKLEVVNGNLMSPPGGQLPNWFLPNSPSCPIQRPAVSLPESLKTNYQMITIPVHNSVRGDSLPEPDIYQYSSTTTLVPFVIYELNTHTNKSHL